MDVGCANRREYPKEQAKGGAEQQECGHHLVDTLHLISGLTSVVRDGALATFLSTALLGYFRLILDRD